MRMGTEALTLIRLVPGIGIMSEPCASSHAKQICDAVALCRSPISSSPLTSFRILGKFSWLNLKVRQPVQLSCTGSAIFTLVLSSSNRFLGYHHKISGRQVIVRGCTEKFGQLAYKCSSEHTPSDWRISHQLHAQFAAHFENSAFIIFYVKTEWRVFHLHDCY